jgi:deazaflavin-dependent oxidoreductase (nitroreductase family)
MISLGVTPSRWPGTNCGTVVLEVMGRRSGRLQSTLVTWVEHGGERYLVTMPGAEPQWVKNAKAAGDRVTLRHGGRRNRVSLQELPVNHRAPILRAWYDVTSLSANPRRHFDLPRNAPIEEFRNVAAQHPVFRVVAQEGASADLQAQSQLAESLVDADRLMRRALWVSVFFNLAGAALFAFPASALGRFAGLPAAVPAVYSVPLALFILLFAAAYAWLARRPIIDRPLVAFSAIGKLSFFIVMVLLALLGDAPIRGALAASGDLIFAGIFTWWLAVSS